MRIAAVALLALALSLVACGSDETTGGNGLAEGGSGGVGGAGGIAGMGGSGGAGGVGGSGGAGGMGGIGGTGGAGGGSACDGGDLQSESCQECIASAVNDCGVSAGCGEGMFALGICAAANGCADEGGLDLVCATVACPEEALAVATCLSACAELRACAGL